MNKKGSIALIIILIVAVVLAVAGGVWYWKTHKSLAPVVIENNAPAASTTTSSSGQNCGVDPMDENTSNCPTGYSCHFPSNHQPGVYDGTCIQTTSTYQNTDYGVSFEYPSNWTVKSGDTAEGDYGLYTQYGPQYAPTAVSLITVEIPPSLYPGTNLEGAYFNLSVDKQLSQSQCSALIPPFGPNNIPDKVIVIDGVTFTRYAAGGVAAGTDEFTENYSGYTNDTCYEFNLGDTTGNDVSATGVKMSGSANDISVLEGVLSSVKFTGLTAAPQASGDNELSSSTAPMTVFPTSGPAPLPIVASVVCRAASIVNQDITVINWGDQTQETCVGTPTSSVIKAIEHMYRTAGTYRASINGPGSSQVSIVVANDSESVMPKITSPNAGAVFVIGSTVPLSWEGIDGIDESVASGTTDYVVASLSDDLATPRGVMGNNDTSLVIPNTDSYQWNTAGISPGEYTFEMGGVGSDEPYSVDPVWFIPSDSSDIIPTVTSIGQQLCSNTPTPNGKFIYGLTIGGTGFTPSSYAYVGDLSNNEAFGSMIPTSVSSDGTALTISSDEFVLNGVYAVKIYNGTHGSNFNETITISCPAS